jgi:hypothetical protein
VRAFTLAGGLHSIADFYAYDPAFPGGVHVAVGEVTGDGIPDIITGAGPSGGPHVRVVRVDGSTLTELASFYAYDPRFTGGARVSAGDIDGDGTAEVIAGAGPLGGPHVLALHIDGSTVTEVASFYAYDPAFRGGVWVGAADVNGDGSSEIVTGAGEGGGPHVRVIRVDGPTLTEWQASMPTTPYSPEALPSPASRLRVTTDRVTTDHAGPEHFGTRRLTDS